MRNTRIVALFLGLLVGGSSLAVGYGLRALIVEVGKLADNKVPASFEGSIVVASPCPDDVPVHVYIGFDEVMRRTVAYYRPMSEESACSVTGMMAILDSGKGLEQDIVVIASSGDDIIDVVAKPVSFDAGMHHVELSAPRQNGHWISIHAGAGNDTLRGSGDQIFLHGGSGDDVLTSN